MGFVSCTGCKRWHKTPGSCPNPTCPNFSAAAVVQGSAVPPKPVAGGTAPKLPPPGGTAPKLPPPSPSQPPAAPPQILVVPGGGAVFPPSLTYAFRGEDDAKGGKKGRSPADVRKDGGFSCWRYPPKDLKPAKGREHLKSLAEAGTLEDQARLWCQLKNRENGWFFSTATAAGAAYDNYDYLYRIDVRALRKRDWAAVGLTTVKNVDKMILYTDQPTVAASNLIAVFWNSPLRTEELLIMTPVPTTSIELKKKDAASYVSLTTA
jgi:hypothetical protein